MVGVAGIVGDVILDLLGNGPGIGDVDVVRWIPGRVAVDGSLLVRVLPQIQLGFALVVRVGDTLSCVFVGLVVAGSVDSFVTGIFTSFSTTVVHLIVTGHRGTVVGLLFTVVTTAGRFRTHFRRFLVRAVVNSLGRFLFSAASDPTHTLGRR